LELTKKMGALIRVRREIAPRTRNRGVRRGKYDEPFRNRGNVSLK
jgi:hypothetical protein